MRRLLIGIILVLPLSVITGCEQEEKFEEHSKLPESIIGYELVFHNTNIIANPDDLYVSSRTVYYFEDANTIRGEGDDGSTLPTEKWEWTGGSPGETYDFVTLLLDYGSNGQELFRIEWNGNEEDITKRQMFSAQFALPGNELVETEGYFEIVGSGNTSPGANTNDGSGDTGSDDGTSGSGDCDDSYGGPTGDPQWETLCKAAWQYECAGETQLLEATCDNLKGLEALGDIPDCPYCDGSSGSSSDGDGTNDGSDDDVTELISAFICGESGCTYGQYLEGEDVDAYSSLGACEDACGGSGGSGGSNDGSSAGQLVIYTTQDHGCGSITVSVNGSYAGTISSYFPNGAPSCGNTDALVIELEPGTHTVSAECGSGGTWNPGSIDVASGGCSSYELR